LALVVLWLISVTAVLVVGIWATLALQLWGPLVLCLGWGGVQACFATLATRRIRRASHPLRSWWSVAVAVLAFPLTVCNLPVILLTVGTIFKQGLG